MDGDVSPIGRVLMTVGGGALTVSVFLTWYSLNVGDIARNLAKQLPPGLSDRLQSSLGSAASFTLVSSGWHAVHGIRFVLLLVGVGALLSAAGAVGTSQSGLFVVGGLLAAGLAIYRIASPPDLVAASLGPFHYQAPLGANSLIDNAIHTHPGPWLAVLGGFLVTLGGWSQLGAKSVTPRSLPTLR